VRPTFLDGALQAEFEIRGFVKIPFLTAQDIAELREVYRDLHHESGFGFQPSFFSADRLRIASR